MKNARRARNKFLGLCSECGALREPGRTMCWGCLAYRRKGNKKRKTQDSPESSSTIQKMLDLARRAA